MLRYSIQTMLRCIRRWRQSPRMIMLFAMLACVMLVYALPFAENARAQGERLQIGEAFVALTNARFSMLIFSCSVILLFCDLPITDRFSINAILRGSRRSYLLGQAFYVLVTSALCATGVLFLSVAAALPNVSFSNAWSRPARLMATSGRVAIDPARLKLTMDGFVVKTFSPYTALMHSYFLLVLLNCFYGIASLVARLYMRAGSFVIVVLANAFSWCASMFGAAETGYAVFSALSPNYHASLYAHANTAMNSFLPTLPVSYAVLTLLIFLLLLLGLRRVGKYDFVLYEEETA